MMNKKQKFIDRLKHTELELVVIEAIKAGYINRPFKEILQALNTNEYTETEKIAMIKSIADPLQRNDSILVEVNDDMTEEEIKQAVANAIKR